MPATEKFMFNRSFDLPDLPEKEEEAVDESEAEEPEIIVPTFSAEEMSAARDEGFVKGRKEGVREASETTERLISETTQLIDTHLSNLFDQQRAANARIFQDAIGVSVTTVKKCFPHLNAKNGIDEIEHIVSEVLAQILEEPRVVINVHTDLKSPLDARLETITQKTHFDGRAVIREDAAIAPGDCRIEWSNGGAERNMDELWQRIDQIVESNLAAEQLQTDVIFPSDSANGSSVRDAGIESVAENETEEVSTAPETVEDSTSPTAPQGGNGHGPETTETGAPEALVSEGENTQNDQNTAPFEPSYGDREHSTGSGPTSAAAATNAPTSTPEEASTDVSMEPDAEAGILTDTPDTETSGSPEQSA